MTTKAEVRAASEAPRATWWTIAVLVSTLCGFVAGYGVSLRTGIEPGYFEAPEAGGYGVAPSGPKMSEELKKYYEGLAK
jgi:hypothetical protein